MLFSVLVEKIKIKERKAKNIFFVNTLVPVKRLSQEQAEKSFGRTLEGPCARTVVHSDDSQLSLRLRVVNFTSSTRLGWIAFKAFGSERSKKKQSVLSTALETKVKLE